ncbi:arylsulfatase B-like [Saccoglossus kowalevskii]
MGRNKAEDKGEKCELPSFVLSVDKPHIVLILGQDLGWNTVGWHNPEIKMPVLNQLAADGVIFNQSYVQPTSTPSRAALFTGYYPFKIKRQHQLLLNLEADGLSLDLKTLPERLKDAGYLTHLVGKWHLGFCKEEYLPNKRGLDSFYGWLTTETSFYSKESGLDSGYDFRDNTGVVQESETYLPFMLAERAVDIVMGHYKEYPLFLEFSMALPGKSIELSGQCTSSVGSVVCKFLPVFCVNIKSPLANILETQLWPSGVSLSEISSSLEKVFGDSAIRRTWPNQRSLHCLRRVNMVGRPARDIGEIVTGSGPEVCEIIHKLQFIVTVEVPLHPDPTHAWEKRSIKTGVPALYALYHQRKLEDDNLGISHVLWDCTFLSALIEKFMQREYCSILVPQDYEDLYSYIEDDRTRKLYGKLSAMDNSIGLLVEALKTRGMWNDTLFIFTSDNGAAASQSGSNWPLRGDIGTLYEGATRIPTFVYGSMLNKTGYVNNELMHIVDLHKTIIELAGATTESDIDGMDMWKTISKGKPSPRTEFVYNIDDDELSPGAAIRVGDYKLITGNPNSMYPIRLLDTTDDWWNYGDDEPIPIGNEPPPVNVTYLFNIIGDPEERNNIAEIYTVKVEELLHRLDEYREHLVPPENRIIDPAGDPVNFGGVWSPGWC